MEQSAKIYSANNFLLTNYSVYVHLLHLLWFWFCSLSSGVQEGTLLLGTTAMYETQYDSSKDELDTASSDLESEDDDRTIFPVFLYNHIEDIVDTYSCLHKLLE